MRRFVIAGAPYESTMGLVQKIFYFHVPSWFAMFTGGWRLRRCQRVLPVQETAAADRVAVAAAELAVLFGADRPGHRPALGRARRGASGGSGTRG